MMLKERHSELVEMIEKGFTAKQIGDILGKTESAVYKYCSDHGIKIRSNNAEK